MKDLIHKTTMTRLLRSDIPRINAIKKALQPNRKENLTSHLVISEAIDLLEKRVVR